MYQSAGWGWPGWGIGRSRTWFQTATTSDSRSYWNRSCSTESVTTECTYRTSSSSPDCRTAHKTLSNRSCRTCLSLLLPDRKLRSRNRVYISANSKRKQKWLLIVYRILLFLMCNYFRNNAFYIIYILLHFIIRLKPPKKYI